MKTRVLRLFTLACTFAVMAWGSTAAMAGDTPPGTPLDLPCAHDVSVEVFGKTAAAGADGMALVSARITIQPGGGFDAHTHPGTVMAFIDQGEFGFTLLEDGMEMSITRGADAGTPAAAEVLVPNQETVLNPGDSFIETGMVHEAWNRGDTPVVVIVSALITADQPLTQCVDPAA